MFNSWKWRKALDVEVRQKINLAKKENKREYAHVLHSSDDENHPLFVDFRNKFERAAEVKKVVQGLLDDGYGVAFDRDREGRFAFIMRVSW